jgi:hypothetical protein
MNLLHNKVIIIGNCSLFVLFAINKAYCIGIDAKLWYYLFFFYIFEKGKQCRLYFHVPVEPGRNNTEVPIVYFKI